ncbi:MAG TPA: hypothetical protein VE547_14430 [Mycobacteriales bacterium]|nr:hypothetical protein [Mycobacteriales bacterium]
MGDGVDVLSSGPDPGPPGRARLRRALTTGLARLRTWPHSRRLLAVLAVLAAVGVVAALRSGAGPAGPVAGSAAGGTGVATAPTVPAPPDPPGGPYDRLPGRVPIPPPTHAGWFVRGTLPPTGTVGEPAAQRGALLVLGRYCARPDRYTLTLDPRPDWRRVDVLVFGLDRSGDPPAVQLQLTWTGRSYAWAGTAVQLNAC